jgi:uncharacterized membrane protein
VLGVGHRLPTYGVPASDVVNGEHAEMAKSRSTTTYSRAALLGVVAGMRSQLPLALLALAKPGACGERALALPWLHAPAAQWMTTLAALGELIGDKLPTTPSRLDPAPLAGRFLFGGLAGGIVAREAGRSPATGALLGAAGAGVGAFTGYHLRAALATSTPIPDPLLGAAEDGVALALGLRSTVCPGND